MRRVVVTGMGIVSPLGNSPDEFFRALVEKKSGVKRISAFDASRLAAPIAAEAAFTPAEHFSVKEIDLYDRFAQMALLASRAALRDSGYSPRDGERARFGVYLGSAYGGAVTYDTSYYALYGQGNDRLHPLSIPRLMHNASTSAVATDTGAQGPSLLISTACASAAHAIGEAVHAIRSGRADGILAGGSDAPVTLPVMLCWQAMRVLAAPSNGNAANACRPFSADRCGLVVGEGAGILLLEEYEAARARGARIYAEVAGYGATSDAAHVTHPSVAGPAEAMRLALADAKLAAESIGYINAHGTGTKVNDAVETRAIREAFGARAQSIPVTSTKALHGHLMGAAGAVELIATVLALTRGVVPPTAHYSCADPECDLDYVTGDARETTAQAALSNSFAFGGLNAVLAVKKV